MKCKSTSRNCDRQSCPITPYRFMFVLGALLALAGTGWSQASRPLIARITAAAGGSVAQVYGEGFEPRKVEARALPLLWPGDPRKNEDVWKAALQSAAQLPTDTRLREVPPKEARPCTVVDSAGQVVGCVMPGWGMGVTAVWLRNAGGEWAAPYLANLPEVWWMDRSVTARGELVKVYGRALLGPRMPTVVLRRGKAVLRAPLADQYESTYHKDSYVAGFIPPSEADPGGYEVWLHNGTGADYGWVKAGMLTLSEKKPAIRSGSLVNVRKHGAQGDGVTDDTAAIRKAVAEAANRKGAVYFPPGLYRITQCLVIPAGVSLKGAGKGNSQIVSSEDGPVTGGFPTELEKWEEKGMPNDWYPFVKQSTPMMGIKSHTTISDLGFDQRGGEGVCLLVANPGESCDNIEVRHCRFRNSFRSVRIDKGYNPSFGGVWIPNRNRNLVIGDNEFATAGAGLVILSRTDRAQILRNRFTSLMNQHADLVGMRGGLVECVVTDNTFVNSKRGLTFQQPQPCMYHNYFARNTVEWIDRGGNANETLLMEGWRSSYCGKATSGTESTITVAGQNWKSGEHKERLVVVMSGRGFGQYGYVADNTEDTLTLTTPWRVPVDGTTTIYLGDFFCDNVFFDHNDRRSGAAFQFWGNCVGNTVDALHSYQSEGVIFWAINDGDRTHGAGPICFYNEVVDSYMVGMGHIEFRGGTNPEADKRFVERPIIVGNIIRDTAVVDYKALPNNQPGPYWKWYGYWMEPFAAVDFWSSVFGKGYRHAQRQPELYTNDIPPVFAHNLIDGCLFQRGARGAIIGKGAAHTVFYNITLDGVEKAWEDQGIGTVLP